MKCLNPKYFGGNLTWGPFFLENFLCVYVSPQILLCFASVKIYWMIIKFHKFQMNYRKYAAYEASVVLFMVQFCYCRATFITDSLPPCPYILTAQSRLKMVMVRWDNELSRVEPILARLCKTIGNRFRNHGNRSYRSEPVAVSGPYRTGSSGYRPVRTGGR
jgi:hypothetical protein